MQGADGVVRLAVVEEGRVGVDVRLGPFMDARVVGAHILVRVRVRVRVGGRVGGGVGGGVGGRIRVGVGGRGRGRLRVRRPRLTAAR